ncbi:TetR/AcrR family transcriptional regulator [Amycolatopsis rubida]|uniref:TetR/AcrR family transcriptional regulator n=1 Tax=Amycolatopsis rubida TaxID=112413 RepID=A0A1I5WAZ3_9PSEU|nr:MULTISPECIES: TetR/AcrR family transcriptional regulator [Amycolatopsis]MYW95257.1 TetR family transcriptional regulator [Amycolatopsis rubida]NEC60246.1 TetR/AcrR family transcriptional regulator [Amycolatopsis rubida]OAP28344.1 putative HTH-type transcriptional regulator [Amycolatopsis sp. M39]SFQ16855.1 WHG domain-containing protein [Amycolatopsis rubida]
MPAAGTRKPMRERFREQVREEVKSAALDQLTAGGAQAISINAIAKQLGVSGPALYRYFSSRDELLNVLVIDAYNDLREAMAHALDTDAPDTEARIRLLAAAYRGWARKEPHRYELLFKAPFPGYDAHAKPLADAARALMGVVLGVLHHLDSAAEARPTAYENEEVLLARRANTENHQLAVALWSRLHGFVSLEIGGGFTAMGLDADALFETEVQVLTDRARRAS